MKLTKDQIVYFFESTGDWAGKIQKGRIKEATKDIYKGSISYLVEYQDIDEYSFFIPSNKFIKITQNQLYTSLKKIQKDYVDYLIYGSWLAKVQKIENLLNEVVEHYSEKITVEGCITLASGNISTSTGKGSLIVDGIGDVAEEINKLKSDVEKIKKKIKKPSKKPVIKEDKKQE